MQAGRGGVEKMCVGETSVFLPSLLKLNCLKSQTCPAFFKTLSNRFKRFVNAKGWHKQLNWLHTKTFPILTISNRSNQSRRDRAAIIARMGNTTAGHNDPP